MRRASDAVMSSRLTCGAKVTFAEVMLLEVMVMLGKMRLGSMELGMAKFAFRLLNALCTETSSRFNGPNANNG